MVNHILYYRHRETQTAPRFHLHKTKKRVISMNTETRDQTLTKIQFHLPELTDAQLRMVAGFIRGILKKEGQA